MSLKPVKSKAFSRIVPRQLSARPEAQVTHYWVAGDPFLTSFFNAFSLVFPAGERFFMDSVRAFRDQLRDPALLDAVRGFMAQESLHSQKHAAFNAALARFGIDAAATHRFVEEDIRARKARRTPLENLAVTCALEHFTALLADSWLKNDALRAEVDEELRALWTWHAIEEVEHKAVAYDVYSAVGGDYATRVRMMAVTTLAFMLGTALLQRELLRKDNLHNDLRTLTRGFFRLWGPRGMLTRLIPGYLRYYLPGFHPSQHDQSALLARFDAELLSQGRVVPIARAA